LSVFVYATGPYTASMRCWGSPGRIGRLVGSMGGGETLAAAGAVAAEGAVTVALAVEGAGMPSSGALQAVAVATTSNAAARALAPEGRRRTVEPAIRGA
jgi:hypothetical protein